MPNPPADALPGVQVHALWPAPVNPDVCFAEAGFHDFADADASRDAQADALLQRVLDTLAAHFGPAQLHSAPLRPARPWYRALFGLSPPQPLPLWEQLAYPLHDDRCGAADIRFGSGRARVRGSDGHLLLWIDWPSQAPLDFRAFVHQVAAGAPVEQTELKWPALWPAGFKRH